MAATKKAAAPAKAVVNSMEGYDPKNRIVLREGLTVKKLATNYNQTFKNATDAQLAFEFQIACSQN